MREARGLLPYAAAAFLLVAVTVVALVVFSGGVPVASTNTPSTSPSATASAATRASTDLSPSGRLAYWRTEPNGDHLLFLANADNSRRRSVAKADQPSAISRTRWAMDGSAVAYVESGVRLVVVGIDGTKTTYTLPSDIRADRYRIVDHRFSPSGARVAATVQRQSGPESDVWLATTGGTWSRLTTTEDVIAAGWISEAELLVGTTAGVIARLGTGGRDQLRPITSLPAATPLVGEDGRVHFVTGRVSSFTGSSETIVSASNASVWSIHLNGEDLRRETPALGSDGFRLDGFWPWGGYLVRRGNTPAQVIVGKDGAVDLPNTAGLIERLVVSGERNVGVGFTGANLVRVDVSPSGAVVNAVVLLGSVSQGDVWFPRTTGAVQTAPVRADVPPARLVFALGGHLWMTSADGVPALLRAGNTNAQTLRQFTLPPPRWSPSGGGVLTVESLGTGASSFQLVPVTIGRDGSVRRYTSPPSVGTLVTWSPDGKQFAVTALPAPLRDPVVATSDLTIALIDAATGGTTASLPGREAVWTRSGVAVLSNGTFRAGDAGRSEQALEQWNGTQRRTVATIAQVVAAPGLAVAAGAARGQLQVVGLSAAPDAAHLAIHVNVPSVAGGNHFAALRARDGTVTVTVSGDLVVDEAWSPAGRLIGYTRQTGTGASAVRRAFARDADTGDTLLDVEGRFAGWSPDGAWLYVARSEGLFARRASGGELVRFSAYGVIVSAAAP